MHNITLLIISSILSKTIPTNAEYTSCDPNDYYSSISPEDLKNHEKMHELLRVTHQNILPYTSDSSSDDVWDALADLDAASSSLVNMIYSDNTQSSTEHGTSDTWNREHVWPKSRGVGKTGADFTDVHSLRPSDWNVNAARGNKLYGSCNTVIVDADGDCKKPAHVEAALDTETDAVVWLPPLNVRGDLARSLMYMAVRYDNDEQERNVVDLVLTDCPRRDYEEAVSSFGVGEMGYLSQLLEWHKMDPVDEWEIERNDRVCKNWQGNRNPFVDFPELADSYFGSLTRPYLGAGLGYDCPPEKKIEGGGSNNGDNGDNSGVDGCKGMEEGDIAIIALASDDPDTVVFVALADIPQGATLRMTDNAWTGSKFRTNEGTKELTISERAGLAPGSVFGYASSSNTNNNLPLSNQWKSVKGSFLLSASGDSIIVYCTDRNSSIRHLTAITYSDDGWLQPSSSTDNDSSVFGADQSAKPQTLSSESALDLSPHKDNYRYSKDTRRGTKKELLQSIGDVDNWEGFDDSDGLNFDFGDGFQVVNRDNSNTRDGITAASGRILICPIVIVLMILVFGMLFDL